jgi:hypothetical protein
MGVIAAATTGLKLAATAATAYSAVKSAKAAKDAEGKQEESLASAGKIQKEQMNLWKNFYKPLEERAVKEAGAGVDPEYMAQRAGEDVRQKFDAAADIQRRNLERMGRQENPQALADLEIAAAAADAGARTSARMQTIKENVARRQDVAALGRGIPGQAMAGLSDIRRGYQQLYEQSGKQASSLMSGAMQAPKMIGDFMKYVTPQQTTPVISPNTTVRTGPASTAALPPQTSPTEIPSSWSTFASGLGV